MPRAVPILPAEDRYNLTFEPPRPPGPSKGRLAFDNRTPAAPPSAVNASTREFVIQYDFDRLVGFSHAGPLSQILNFAREVNAREIEIVGHRGAVLLSNGRTMVEEPTIGKQRAEQVSMLLQGANLKEPSYKVSVAGRTRQGDRRGRLSLAPRGRHRAAR